jgi:hypothetical protein
MVAGGITQKNKKTGCANEQSIYPLMLMVLSYAFWLLNIKNSILEKQL